MNISFPPLNKMDIEDHPIVICAKVGRHDIHRMGNHLAFRTNPPASILGKVPIPSYGIDELYSSKIAFTIQRNSRKAENTCAGSSSIYRPWHDKISNKSKGCHNQNEKSQVAIHPEYPEQSIMIGGDLTDKGKKAICELGVKEGTPPVRQKKQEQDPERSNIRRGPKACRSWNNERINLPQLDI
ncbi:hypothetical protein Tco_0001567 [Tanacetum coccineum]